MDKTELVVAVAVSFDRVQCFTATTVSVRHRYNLGPAGMLRLAFCYTKSDPEVLLSVPVNINHCK